MKRTLLAAAAVFALAGAVQAQEARQPPNPDLDHDGKVTLAEYQQMADRRIGRLFERLDADHDGKITAAEFDAAPRPEGAAPTNPARGGRMLARMDANGDGVVTKEELQADAVARFNAADTNHDGWLSPDEMAMMQQSRTRGGQ